MDLINHTFQILLEKKGFPLKIIESADHVTYKGRFFRTEVHGIDFALNLTRGETTAVAQIVFRNIGYVHTDDDEAEWYEFINALNHEYGMFYYFVLDEQNKLYMRHISEVGLDLEPLVNILLKGPYLLQEVVPELEDRFGPFVII